MRNAVVFGVLARNEQGCDTLRPAEGDPSVQCIERGIFPEPFQTTYDWDAHCVQYHPVARDLAKASQAGFDPEEAFLRFNKPVLPQLREIGVDLVSGLLVLDWDCGTRTVTKADLDAFWAAWVLADDKIPHLTKTWRTIYTTRGGLRVVYVLDQPVPVDEFETVYKGVLSEFHQVGIRFDTACSDWTRLFRLPRVTRDGVPQESLPTFEQIWAADPSTCLVVATLSRVGAVQGPATQVVQVGPVGSRPTPEECAAILTGPTGGPSEFAKIARRWLVGREAYEIAFGYGVFDAPGFLNRITTVRQGGGPESARHDALRFVICQAATLICPYAEDAGLGTVGPEHLYALVHKAVEQLPAERDWAKEAWDLCVWAWRREESQILTARAKQVTEEKKQEEDKRTLEERILDGVREWDPSLPAAPADAAQVVQKRLVILYKSVYSVMGPSGRYEGEFVTREGLVAKIESLGMESVIATRVPRANGEGYKLASIPEITKDRLTNVGKFELSPNIGAGYLKDLESPEPTLVQESYAIRTDIEADFSPEVDEWLQCFAGKDYAKLNEYLGKIPAEGPLPGIALIGASGAGKGLLVRGILDCFRWRTGVVATADDLVNNWNEALANCPIVLVNEGWPEGPRATNALDISRKLVSGDHVEIRQRYRDKVIVTVTPRLILCGNNVKILHDLCLGRDLRPEDRIALAQRFVFVNVERAATELLATKGGYRYTRDWVSGNTATPYVASPCVLAKHIMWLYERHGKNAKAKMQGRFLMQGDVDSHVVRMLRTQGGSTPIVIEVVVDLVESPATKTDGSMGVLIEIPEPIQNGTVHYTSGTVSIQKSAIMNRFRTHFYKTSPERLTVSKLDAALHGLLANDVHGTGMEDRGDLTEQSSWCRLDARLLLEQAKINGWNHRRLEAVVSGRPIFTVLPGRNAADRTGQTLVSG